MELSTGDVGDLCHELVEVLITLAEDFEVPDVVLRVESKQFLPSVVHYFLRRTPIHSAFVFLKSHAMFDDKEAEFFVAVKCQL